VPRRKILAQKFRLRVATATQGLQKADKVGKAAVTGVLIFNESMALLTNLAALGVAGFAIWGTSSNASNRSAGFIFDVNATPLPLRLLLIIIIAASMGWMLGALVSKLSTPPSETRLLFGLLGALATGTLLVLSASWLALDARRTALPELYLFVCIGLGIALWVTRFQFSQRVIGVSGLGLRMRMQAMFAFTLVCLLVLALTLMGAR
jgi:hypothetical protein